MKGSYTLSITKLPRTQRCGTYRQTDKSACASFSACLRLSSHLEAPRAGMIIVIVGHAKIKEKKSTVTKVRDTKKGRTRTGRTRTGRTRTGRTAGSMAPQLLGSIEGNRGRVKLQLGALIIRVGSEGGGRGNSDPSTAGGRAGRQAYTRPRRPRRQCEINYRAAQWDFSRRKC